MVDARNATAADFDEAAQRQANAFWFFVVVGGLVWWFASPWWAIIPGALALVCAISSITSTRAALALRSGRYKIPNPNNGAPDGDMRNFDAGS